MPLTLIRGFLTKYRSLLSLGSAALLAELAYAILNLSALPMYVTYTLKQGPLLGVIISTFLLTEAVSRPAFGALGDRIGRKPLMIAGPLVTAFTAYLTIHFHSPFILIGLRAVDGLGSGALWPTAFAAVGDLAEEKNRSTAMSMLNVTYMSGLALGFLLGGVVNQEFGTYAASFYLVSILLLMSVLVMLFFLPSKMHHQPHPPPVYGEPLEVPTLEEPTEFKLGNLLRSFREVPDMIVLACVTFLGMGMLMPIVKLYAVQHLAMSETQFGIMVAPVAAVMGISAVPLGRVGDKYGRGAAVSWGLFASAMAMWVLALFRSVTLAALAGVVLGLGFTVAFPAWMALVASSTSPGKRGEVIGAVGMAQGLAAIIGTSLGAFVYSADYLSIPRLGIVNYNLPFWLSAILLSIGTVMTFLWVCGRNSTREPGGGVGEWQRKFVVFAAIAGLVGIIGWVGYRYSNPVPPDRVAWAWVQQLARGRVDRALKYAAPVTIDGCDARAETERVGKRYYTWEHDQEARYTVLFPESVTGDRAVVPVKFTFLRNRIVIERILLVRTESGEWRVCRVLPRT